MKVTKYFLLIIFLILIGYLTYVKFFRGDDQISRSVTDAPKYYARGIEFYKDKKYPQALRELDRAIQSNPEYKKAYLKSAHIYIEQQKYDDALAYFDELVIQNPKVSFSYFAKGLIFTEKKDYKSAIQNYQQAIQLNPKFAAFYISLAVAFYKSDRLDEGIEWISNIIKADGTNPFAFYGLAYAYKLQSNWEKVFENLDQALQINSELIEAYCLKIESLTLTGKLDEALKIEQFALDLAQKAGEPEVKVSIILAINSAKSYLGQYEIVLKSYQELLLLTQDIGDRYLESNLINNIGYVYRILGEFDKSIIHLKRSIEMATEINNREIKSRAIGNLGLVYLEQAKYDSALFYLTDAVALAREIKDKLTEARRLGAIAALYSYIADFPKASAYGDTAIQIYRKLGNKSGESTELGNIGANQIELGNYPNAIHYINQALTLSRQIGEKYLQYMQLGFLGNAHFSMGDYKQAIDYFSQAYQMILKANDQGAASACLLNIADAENELGKFEAATKNFHRALDIFIQIGDRRGEGLAAAGLANMSKKLLKYQDAQVYYNKALEIAQEIHNRFGEAKTLNELGILSQKLGKYPDAMAYHQKALKIGNEIASLEILYETNYVIGQVNEKQGKILEAIQNYKQAITIIENIRSDFELEEHKVTFFENKIEIYERLIQLLFKINQQKPNQNFDKETFYYAEKAKARALLDLLTESKIDINLMLEPELQKRQKEIYQKISEILTDLRNEKLTVDQQNELNSQLKAEEDRLQTLQIEFRRKNPAYTSLQYATPLTIQTVQKEVLQKDELLLEYVLGETQSFLWAVDQKSCQIYALPSENEITKMVKRYIQIISHPPKPGITLQSEGKILFDLILKPVTGLISNYQRLIIIPDAILFYLPYETLIHSTKHSEAGYLMETCEISYSPSTSVLHWLRQEQKRSATTPSLELLAFGDPIFGNEAASSTKRTPFSENPERGFYDQQGFDLARLPYTAAEIENIIQTLPAKSYVTHLRADAQEERVKSDDLHQYRRLHFATHGILDETLPGRSCIVLTLDDDPNEDGFLQVNEIFNLKLNADLVTLSACQTGRGKVLRGEGVLGLTRAFLYAGTNSVLVSLWSVNDRSTANLMTQFYQFLAQGKSKVQALQQAKLKLLTGTNPTLRHPYYWAGFVLIGNGGN